ncbi:hypothetical protein [Pseudomonas syringae group genomosp. 7]|uniref:hypothetical protein n=1 Tax=Pseudomonas syringae group genomosp. 7 TaxID=251699 RepID=UPI000F00A31F|nr:hypothetical protein [Pseudomonas syringae group genomosp. 7]RMR07134.1 hypothetical protein ALP93_200060 [Pseudomonas syringae pv. helianthi]
MIRVLLTLDLIKSEDERTKFYNFLSKQKWQKTKDVDTVWTLTFPKLDIELPSACKKAKAKIRDTFFEAVEKFRLEEISYIAQIGNHQVISRLIKKKNGEYKCLARKLYPVKEG